MEKVKRLNHFVVKVERLILVLMMSAMMIIGMMQVIFREIVKQPLVWSEGMLTYLFIWSAFMGAALGTEKMEHFCIDALVDKFPKKAQCAVEVGIYIVLLAAAAFVVTEGIYLALAQRECRMPTINASMMWPYLSLPCSFLLIFYHSLTNLICLVWDKEKDRGEQ